MLAGCYTVVVSNLVSNCPVTFLTFARHGIGCFAIAASKFLASRPFAGGFIAGAPFTDGFVIASSKLLSTGFSHGSFSPGAKELQ